ncbi:MAG TPA: DEAD/DEAH box helicase [Methanocella sp.]|uniref:DEAD/DEAH box helicase n=1 Tax=Methanocella sp. TaxID=2052833 RepID=UPI002BF3643D|nr:DEAD/DEAH box helicase [Methanocella sp.]HTY91084.1 DEAD/DEAH box helicase [Methanocella sp.]
MNKMLPGSDTLPVADIIDERFREMFPYGNFNRMQSKAVPTILASDDNAVVSAPTASGKTVLAEAAMVRELGKAERGKILFIAPLRALTNEKEAEWKRVLSKLGFKVYVVTGERELYPSEARSANVIITTPEKWDSATRKYQQERYAFVQDVALVIVDEVHLLDSDSRGGTLEAVISRMRRISAQNHKMLRTVALSATMPNIGDVARWIGAPPGNVLEFDGSYRPVDLETSVLPYYPKPNDFLNKYVRLYKAFDLVKDELGDGHQALIFVSTRQDTQQAAEKLCEIVRKNYPYMLPPFEAIRLQEIRNKASNAKLKACLPCAIAFHHAGLSAEDKALIEGAFREGLIRILVSTSTLAWGVNLPARVVVIRDVEMYDPIQGNKDISPIDLLQMLGRAGRPGYDTLGKGYVIVPSGRAEEYRALLRDGKPIESVLEHSLAEHLNAEIAVGMVKSAGDAADWIRTTFYYVRSQGRIDVEPLAGTKVKYLIRNGFVREDTGVLSPTPLGTITSDFYLRLETALLFREQAMRGALSTNDVLDIVARAAEFSDVAARPGEMASLKSLGIDAGPGGMAKVRAILAGLIGRTLPDELKSDAWAIKQNASRLLSAFSRFCEEFSGEALSKKVRMVSLQIDKGIPEEAVELASIEGVGERSMELLVNGGIRSLRDAADKKPEDLIRMGIRGPVAIDIVEAARKMPKAEVDLTGVPGKAPSGALNTSITLRNVGADGKLAVKIKASGMVVKSDRLYLGRDSSRTIPVELQISGETPVEITIDYVDTMLPADTWKTTIKLERPAIDNGPVKTAKNVTREVIELTPGKYYVIAGEAGVEYEGKTKDSYDGSVVLLIKPDSSVVVHADKGVYPRNYMGRAHIIQVNEENGMKISAESNGERLSVSFRNIEMCQAPFDKGTPASPVKNAPTAAGPAVSDEDRALEKALRDARRAKASELKVPPYTIFQDKTIYDLIAKKPKTKGELQGVYGIGQAKADKYGDLILKVLSGQT